MAKIHVEEHEEEPDDTEHEPRALKEGARMYNEPPAAKRDEHHATKKEAPPVATKEAPPPEAPSHKGQAAYVLSSDVNIAHQDYKKGDTVMLTHDQYKTLRAADVHCVPVPQPPTEGFNQTHSRR